MGKWWSLLFGTVILACTLLFVVAPFIPGWWLPSLQTEHGAGIDLLFYIILGVTGFFFVLTEGLLILFIWIFSGRPKTKDEDYTQPPPKHPIAERMIHPFKKIIPDANRLELVWTAIPAVLLFLLAVVQVPSWAVAKYYSYKPEPKGKTVPFQLAVSARQFEWRMRYPSPETWKRWKRNPKLMQQWHKNPEFDDVHVPNELHIWTNEKAKNNPAFVVHLSTIDVQHNLNIPHFRVKQDALPGQIIPVWFRPIKSNGAFSDKSKTWVYRGGNDERGQAKNSSEVWEIACAELCGRWHYHMVGKVYVHPSEEDFLRWLEHEAAKQRYPIGAKKR